MVVCWLISFVVCGVLDDLGILIALLCLCFLCFFVCYVCLLF